MITNMFSSCSERLDAIDAIEAKRRRVEAEQSRYKDFDDSFDRYVEKYRVSKKK